MKVTERNAVKTPGRESAGATQGFEKKRFVLTQDDLIYYDKKDESRLKRTNA